MLIGHDDTDRPLHESACAEAGTSTSVKLSESVNRKMPANNPPALFVNWLRSTPRTTEMSDPACPWGFRVQLSGVAALNGVAV